MFVFLHIPKNAGTTVRTMVRKQLCPLREIEVDDISRFAHRSDAWIAAHDFVSGHFGAGFFARLPEDAVRYTVLRDPVDRVRSQYRYFRRLAAMGGEFNGYQALFAERTLRQVIEDRTEPFFNSFFCDTQTWALVSDYQHHYRDHSADPGAVLEIAQGNLLAMDAFGIVERMADSARLLNARFGWGLRPHDWSETRLNGSPGPGTEDAPDSALDAAIRERNPLDVALYDWAMAEFAKRLQSITDSPGEQAGPSGRPHPRAAVRSLHVDSELANGTVGIELLRERARNAERTNDELAEANRGLFDWANRTESTLASERRLSLERLAWAERTEARLAAERARSAELHDRLLRAERELEGVRPRVPVDGEPP